MKYFIIVHKPFSEDYCMGCRMETYWDDFDIIECDTDDELIQKLAEVKSKNNFLGMGEDARYINVIIFDRT